MKHSLLLGAVQALGVLALLAPALVAGQAPGSGGPTTVTLASMRDLYRPLLVFAASNGDPRLLEQVRLFARDEDELHQRQVILVPVQLKPGAGSAGGLTRASDLGSMSAAEAAVARKRFHVGPGDFTVLLLGKDGGEKLRSHAPIAYATLRDTIDAMPMRQQEMRQPK